MKANKRKFTILDGLSGRVAPGRMTLLLGPPGAGKSTLLSALAGKLRKSDLQMKGSITYNGHTFDDFIPERTASYIDQTDTHLAELTVRETFDFAARCQGTGHKGGKNYVHAAASPVRHNGSNALVNNEPNAAYIRMFLLCILVQVQPCILASTAHQCQCHC